MSLNQNDFELFLTGEIGEIRLLHSFTDREERHGYSEYILGGCFQMLPEGAWCFQDFGCGPDQLKDLQS